MRVVSRRASRIDMSSRNLFTLPVHGKLCTCLGSFVSRREKNLIPLTGHRETERADGFRFTWKDVSLHSGKAIRRWDVIGGTVTTQ